MKVALLCFLLLTSTAIGQTSGDVFEQFNDDLSVSSDIFSDYNDDLESSQVLEDERFYRYGRFFAVNLGVGVTTFTGNRGAAYFDQHPTFNFNFVYFFNFHTALVLGVAYSSHRMVLDSFTAGSKDANVGLVQTDMIRSYIGYRFYLDTKDLGTAITYSNPYFIGRFEYWFHRNKFLDEGSTLEDQSLGGVGLAAGFGLEFPLELKKRYLNMEFLFHNVAFKDRYTSDYRRLTEQNCPTTSVPPQCTNSQIQNSVQGYNDLDGFVLTFMMNYTISW